MRYRQILLALAALLPAQSVRAIEPADLKPGLVATFSSPANVPVTKAASVTRLEPTVAFTLNAGESAHPKLGVTAVAEWTGYINVTRTGKYSFSALVRGGTLTVKVGGKQVASAGPQGTTEDVVNLEGGVQSFEARFVRGNEPTARVELFWQGAGFIKEPLPNQFLGHLAKDRPEHFTTDAALEHGRFKFEELGCVKCHRASTDDKMARGLVEHTGPNLTEIAKRAYPGWIYTWLEDPTKLRTHTTMPKTFRNDATGAAERFAVTQYLISLSGKPLDVYKLPTIPSDQIKQSMDRGRVLYSVAGCAACHSDPLPKKKKDDDEEKEPLAPVDFVYGLGTLSGPTPKYSLGGLGSKTRPEALAAYLANPLKTNPHGRMPNMNLNAGEAIDLARYLCRVPDENVTPEMPEPESTPIALLPTVFPKLTAEEQKRFARLKPQSQWAELGAQLALTKGCVNCHSIEQNGKPVQPLQTDVVPTLDQIKKADAKGCLTEKPNATKAPVYKLDPKEREDIAAFVRTGLEGDGAPAPAYQARVALRRFNCLNCHQRDGEGGIPTELADQMRQLEKAENADDVRPPMLTGVGHKTRTSWLKAVLTQSGRARPWMQLRMPQYGEPNVGFLPEAVAALEGTVPDDKVHVVERTAAKVAAGREIIGKGGLGCISCHDIGGYTNTGTRGPNLATIDQRVRYEWYERWLSQPLRMAPGTRMPQAFVDGKSTLTTMLNASPHLQGEAMWAYLALGPDLPLPDGLEPPRGVVVAVKDRPEVLRTFMPDAGSKAVAVGYPGYVSLAFSADQCRTAYAWGGNFLDASPVWANRGGNPAKLLGQKFWTAPPGHPWGLTKAGAAPPDFLTRASNPAFGLPMPLEPARIYDGPMAVKFDGYSLDKDGKPTFRYRLDETLKGQPELAVAETPVPLKGSVATGLGRKFELVIPGSSQVWFLAGVTNKEPRLYDATGKAITLDLKAEEVTSPATARVILSADGRATLVDATGAPDGSSWRFVPTKNGGWLAVLKLPSAKDEKIVRFALNLWALPKDDDTILKELFGR
ncbi:probable cytochrome oxidase (cbb3-type) : Probable cytochrome oxidase (Cbb3-type) OS=Planctomyces maris DSM 8797 GN=PM8797T_08489 PE=4 SV=1: PA14: Cytochrom_C [Gemmata massiliana]|uniref:Cytochrome c n=1 Tax=Gemmata massiliana TaxID=1210884 RepID=A0A6P2D4Q1_9BACT|nr:c-type cytochrome [Gemmata massiliana]VTR94442.1 probable cytochrome oxidase (cbb3-type) : Probable cytochrome oxidase (Cbb3-type) OS=Planctomyces maris DSM 8797 GN=PM8797T_08489 PE=4 SV=1: PA14: Cytochrom_C [Gemmata massiliana]